MMTVVEYHSSGSEFGTPKAHSNLRYFQLTLVSLQTQLFKDFSAKYEIYQYHMRDQVYIFFNESLVKQSYFQNLRIQTCRTGKIQKSFY